MTTDPERPATEVTDASEEEEEALEPEPSEPSEPAGQERPTWEAQESDLGLANRQTPDDS
jgi:hypothetical protein